MGKSKCKKSKHRRPRPTAVPSIKEMEEDDELNTLDVDQNTVQSVLEKIQGVTAEEKECGATIIAQMADKTDFVTQFIQCEGPKILSVLLIDSSPAVRHTACGSLRNLCVSGDHKISEEMVKQDVMTPLVCLFKQYSTSWSPSSCPKGKIDSKTETFIEACYLLSSLCQGSDVALKAFNRNNLILILLPCLNVQDLGPDVTSAVVQCLHVVTEDNPEVIEKISACEREMLFSLLALTNDAPAHVYLRILAGGIILNLNSGKIDSCEPSVRNRIMNILEETLDICVQSEIEGLAQDIHSYTVENKDKYREKDELQVKFSAIVDRLLALQSVLSSKKIALEILTNICCSNDEEEWDDMEGSSASEELSENEETSSISVNNPQPVKLDLSCEVLEIIIGKKLVHKVVQQIVVPHEEIIRQFEEISEGREFVKRLHTVRSRALFCLNNIIEGLGIEELGGKVELFKLWLDLSVLVFSQTDAGDVEQLQAATGSVRAVLQKLSEANASDDFMKMTNNDLKLFFEMWVKSNDSTAQVNIMRSVAIVGCILANTMQPNSYALVKEIGAFLSETCLKSSDLWVVAEALDATFDVFSEDHLDSIAQEIGLVEKLKVLLPTFKWKIKQHYNPREEHFPIVEMAKTNLVRFLKYKAKCYKKKSM